MGPALTKRFLKLGPDGAVESDVFCSHWIYLDCGLPYMACIKMLCKMQEQKIHTTSWKQSKKNMEFYGHENKQLGELQNEGSRFHWQSRLTLMDQTAHSTTRTTYVSMKKYF